MPRQEERREGLIEQCVGRKPRIARGDRLGVANVGRAEASVAKAIGDPLRITGVVHQIDDRIDLELAKQLELGINRREVEHALVVLDPVPWQRQPHAAHPGGGDSLQVAQPLSVVSVELGNVDAVVRQVGALEGTDERHATSGFRCCRPQARSENRNRHSSSPNGQREARLLVHPA